MLQEQPQLWKRSGHLSRAVSLEDPTLEDQRGGDQLCDDEEEQTAQIYETYTDHTYERGQTPIETTTSEVARIEEPHEADPTPLLHDPEPYIHSYCRQCGEMFTSYEKFKSHNLEKHGGTYMCSVCFRGYEGTHELKKHMSVHSLKRFKCPTCRSTYSTRSSLIRHQKSAHNTTTNSDNKTAKPVCGNCGKHRGPGHMCYTCTECTAQFRSKESFTAHECNKTRVYSCPYCSEQFTRRTGVLNHIMNEENKRKFHCGHCGMRFNTSAQLRRHERLHEPTSWYRCTLCTKKYSTASGLRLHNVKIHKQHIPNSAPQKSPIRLKKRHHPIGTTKDRTTQTIIRDTDNTTSTTTATTDTTTTTTAIIIEDDDIQEINIQDDITTSSSANQDHITSRSNQDHITTSSSANQDHITSRSNQDHITTSSSANQDHITSRSNQDHITTSSSANQDHITSRSNQDHITTSSSANQDHITSRPSAIQDHITSPIRPKRARPKKTPRTMNWNDVVTEVIGEGHAMAQPDFVIPADIQTSRQFVAPDIRSSRQFDNHTYERGQTPIETTTSEVARIEEPHEADPTPLLHDPEPYIHSYCRQCGEMFTSYEKFKSHNLEKHGGTYMCSVCFRGYEGTHELKKHMSVHSLKRFKCPTCRSTYSTRSSLIRHQKSAHNTTTNSDNKTAKPVCGNCGKHRGPGHMCYTCTECTAQFRSKESFTAHECNKTRVYSCPYCSEQFTRRTGVLNHIMNEENKRKFHCGHCGMRFNTSAQLRRHERLHEPTSWYRCTLCTKKYSTASGLRLHNVKIHKQHIPNSAPQKSPIRLKKRHHPIGTTKDRTTQTIIRDTDNTTSTTTATTDTTTTTTAIIIEDDDIQEINIQDDITTSSSANQDQITTRSSANGDQITTRSSANQDGGLHLRAVDHITILPSVNQDQITTRSSANQDGGLHLRAADHITTTSSSDNRDHITSPSRPKRARPKKTPRTMNWNDVVTEVIGEGHAMAQTDRDFVTPADIQTSRQFVAPDIRSSRQFDNSTGHTMSNSPSAGYQKEVTVTTYFPTTSETEQSSSSLLDEREGFI
eukprot:sb/3461468/